MRKDWLATRWGIGVTGAVVGIAAAALVKWGNPGNMGICIACFERDIAGALRLHSASSVQYLRPEIIGILMGAFAAAAISGEHRVRGGASPLLRFVLGVFLMIGALVFLGCPMRLTLRLGGGDGNALAGLAGLVAGIWVASRVLVTGYAPGRSQALPLANHFVMPLVAIGLLAMLLIVPSAVAASTEGPGSMHAPILVSLLVGALIGALGQKSRLCFAGGIRDAILVRDTRLLLGFVSVVVFAVLAKLCLGQFRLGFDGQPAAHTQQLWNFLGMALVGLCAVLLGGCPFRQLIMSAEGNTDSALVVLGMVVGAALSHNFGLASSGKGTTPAGRIVVLVGIVVVLLAGIALRQKAQEGRT